MQTNRRNWLKQISIVVAGSGIAPFTSFASPAKEDFSPDDISIRLNANENPYGPSPSARIAMAKNMAFSNRYHREHITGLAYAIAQKNNLTPENILITAGSTEVLDLNVRLAALNKGSFVVAEPTFSYWSGIAETMGLEKIAVPLTADKKNDLPAMLKAIRPDTKMLYVCNPNNPTGTICNHDELTSFIKEATKKVMVLADEAYIDFTTEQSISSIVKENKNLIVAKTFSKIYGLAGARIGYALANPETIEQLSRLQSWSNGSISVASAAAALASLQDEKFVKEVYSSNEKVKKYTIEKLESLNIPCIPSYTNFIYFSLANYKKDFFNQLKINKIMGTAIYEEKGKWSRITVGTMQEMQKFISAIA